jgi:hypothetical protein
VGTLDIKAGTNAADNGIITLGGFLNERLRIASDGNVGIGTNNPGATLDVNGGIQFAGHIIPTLDATYDIGTPEKRVREIFVSNNSLWIGDRAKISFVRGRMVFKHRKLNHIPHMVRQIALNHGRQDETEIEQEVIEHTQTVDPTVSTLEDIRIEHWRDYTKSMDETKDITDIFADNDEDYEAVTAADAFKEVGANIFTTHSLSIGKETEPTAPLDVNGTIKATTFEGTATNTTQIRLTESTGANTSYRVPFAAGSSGNQTLHTDAGLTYNPSTNKLYTTASSATTLENARKINGVSFDGSADITVNGTQYNINDGWLKHKLGSENFVKLFGGNKCMVFRTDNKGAYGNNGSYPFIWNYGGDDHTNRRMILNENGQLWCSNYGWLHSKFAYKGGDAAVDFSCDRLYYDDWLRCNGTGAQGLYWHHTSNPGYNWHIYPESRADMTFRTGSGNGGIRGKTSDNNTRGYVHWTTANEIGFLNSGRSWSLRMDNAGTCFITKELYVNAGWVRTYGTRGWYNQSYGGGWYMTDTSWVRAYNNKGVYAAGAFYTDGNRSVIRGGSPTLYFRDTNQLSGMIHVNGERMYFLRGGVDTETWSQVGGRWPLELVLSKLVASTVPCTLSLFVADTGPPIPTLPAV